MDSSSPKMGFLNGERIYLREVRPSDANEAYYNWMNNPEINRYLESRFYPHSIENLTDFIIKTHNDPNTVFLAIIHKEKNQHIGNIKLGPINWIHRHAHIGILIGERNFWGQGLATETIKLMVQYAFGTLNLHKLLAGCDSNNPGSARAFEKAGFFIEGVRKAHFYNAGHYIDELLLAQIKP